MPATSPDSSRDDLSRDVPAGVAGPPIDVTQPLPAPLDKLDVEERAAVCLLARTQTHAADECLFREGDAGDGFYIIDEGQVRIELERPEIDTDAVLGFVPAGHILGEMSVLDESPRSASAFAHWNTVVRHIDAAALEQLLRTHPRVYAALVSALGRSVSEKLRKTNDRLAAEVFPGRDADVDAIVSQAADAQRRFESWDEARVDALLKDLAEAVADKARELATTTVAETKMGNVEDKVLKNVMASVGTYNWLAGKPAAGTIAVDEQAKVTELASPVGVVFGLVPITNPIATAIFKTIITLKGRNALILNFPRTARTLGATFEEIISPVLARHRAPEHIVQWVKNRPCRRKTDITMRHPGISLILATGGAGLVRAAYSSGTPALGVGPGNAPALIAPDADLKHAAGAIVMSKSFDNGLICGSEHHLVVTAAVREQFIEELNRAGALVVSDDQIPAVTETVFSESAGGMRPRVVGRDARTIAQMAGIECDRPVRLLVVPTEGVSAKNPLASEKMAPVLSLFTASDVEDGLSICRRLLDNEGAGHTAVIHTKDKALIERFGREMPASRILINAPAAHGVVGGVTGLPPSLVLGCGTFGKNSTGDNVNYKHLLNIKRVADYRPERMLDYLPLLARLRK
jgi:acyl-CoA reductase-like NAD-dependent aldehyde dehydrogenase